MKLDSISYLECILKFMLVILALLFFPMLCQFLLYLQVNPFILIYGFFYPSGKISKASFKMGLDSRNVDCYVIILLKVD
jgi:hypothetical protein